MEFSRPTRRRPRSNIGAAVAAFLAGGALLAIAVDCGPGRFEGLTDGLRDSGASDRRLDVQASTRGTCLARCAEKFPRAVALDDEVDDCLGEACHGSCDSEDPALIAAELDGGAEAAAGCAVPITAFSANCNLCVRARCCKVWAVCYGDPDSGCEELDECYEACPE